MAKARARRSTTAAPSKRARHPLDAIFRPRSVAVIGASRREHSIGRELFMNLVEFGFTGPVYPVNPAAPVIRSMVSHPDLESIPGPVDLAVVIVPRERVADVVKQCGRKGVNGLVVISAGFKEVGGKGVALEERLQRDVRRYGMRMIGPNCMGVINTDPGIQLNATFAATTPVPGNVGFVSQSGALGEAILADAVQRGLGVAMFVSMGNKTDVSGNDFLEYWENDPRVEAILMYLESFGRPRRFLELARRITRKKPIITVKAGRTPAGARAAVSHTGALIGSDMATQALLEQAGVLRVSSMEEMFVQASALANQPVPSGDRIAIVTNAGGPGILCTDACIGRGLRLAEFSGPTRRAVAKLIPPEASAANPIDMIASADAARYRAVLDRVVRDPNVDGVIAIFVSPITIDAYEVARAIAEHADGSKPMLSVFMGKQRSDEGVEELRRHKVPVYNFPEAAASGMAALVRYRRMREAPRGRHVRYRADRDRARRAIRSARRASRTELSADESMELLAAYGIRMAPTRVVRSAAEAIAAAIELGYPVVLKAISERFSHKSDVGGVRVDLRTADEVGRAYADIHGRLSGDDPAMSVAVQPMVVGGREVILGMTQDPRVGPLILFGLGGIFVEVMKDVSVGVHPITDVDARAMVARIQGYPLLSGARGEAPVDLGLIESSLLRLSQLVGDFGTELAEMDLNPLIVTEQRARSFVVDARIRLTERGGSS